jgi:hypothetical protein
LQEWNSERQRQCQGLEQKSSAGIGTSVQSMTIHVLNLFLLVTKMVKAIECTGDIAECMPNHINKFMQLIYMIF